MRDSPYRDILFAYFPLGWITFGGPQAHLSLLFNYFVTTRKWVSEQIFAEMVGLGQGLPGPTSTQVAFAIAICRAGLGGGFFGFFWWSFPGFIIMTMFGLGVNRWLSSDSKVPEWLLGLEDGAASAAVGLVAIAAVKLSESQVKDKLTTVIAFTALALTLLLYSHNFPWLFPTVMAVSGLITAGRFYYRRRYPVPAQQPAEADASSEQAEAPVHVADQGDGAHVSMHSLQHAEGRLTAHAASNDARISMHSLQLNDEKAAVPAQTPAHFARASDAEDEDEDVIFEDDGATLMLNQQGGGASSRAKDHVESEMHRMRINYSIRVGLIFLALYVVVLVLCVTLRGAVDSKALHLFEAFLRVGSMIFGGGQVVIPMLLDEVVKTGWVTERQFLFGFAFVSALPGPMFNFSAYLGAIALGFGGALLAWIGLFFPGLFLIIGVMPLWHRFRTLEWVQAVFVGVNACACGLIVAAVYLLWNKAVKTDALNAVLAMGAYVAVGKFNAPAAAVIIAGGLISMVRSFI